MLFKLMKQLSSIDLRQFPITTIENVSLFVVPLTGFLPLLLHDQHERDCVRLWTLGSLPLDGPWLVRVSSFL